MKPIFVNYTTSNGLKMQEVFTVPCISDVTRCIENAILYARELTGVKDVCVVWELFHRIVE